MVLQLNPALQPPCTEAASTADTRRIVFRHPAYPNSTPPLLELSAFDDGGIDYDTAFASCCIVTGNKWQDGWLALGSPDSGLRRVRRPADGVLREAVYYFCLSQDTSEKYPVIPSFDHWRFPHDDLPFPWSALAIPTAPPNPVLKHKHAAQARDRSCRITGYVDACEVAHIVPMSSGHWFISNGMKRYCRLGFDHLPINDESNLILLRRDLHHLFDQPRFVFIPKRFGDKAPQITTHVLLPRASKHMLELYHNRAPHPLTGLSPEFLLARYAWALFTDENMPFFRDTHEYVVLLFEQDNGKMVTEKLRGGTAQLKERASLFEAYRSRSVSPRKRQLGDGVDDGVDDESDDGAESWGSSAMDEEEEDCDEMRGRPRKRRTLSYRQLPYSPPPPDDPSDTYNLFTSASASTSNTAISQSHEREKELKSASDIGQANSEIHKN